MDDDAARALLGGGPTPWSDASGGNPYGIGSDHWPGLAKLLEEAGEVGQVGGKLVATGGARWHWDGTDLVEALEDELADVTAAAGFVAERNGLDLGRIAQRVAVKAALFDKWQAEGAAERST